MSTPAAETVRVAREGLHEAGEALRRRPAGEVLAALGRVLDGWADPGSAWRKALLAAHPAACGFDAATVERGLELALADWNAAALERLVRAECGGAEALDAGRATGFPTTAVLLAGAIPMPTLLSMISPLVLRSPVLVKPARRDPVTAALVARSIAEVDAELGACVQVVALDRDDPAALDAFLAAPCVVATGSDESVAAVAARVTPPQRFVAYGHRASVSLLGPEATDAESVQTVAEQCALDVALWDQLGCLSPLAFYVTAEDPTHAPRFAEALAAALDRIASRLPRGPLPTEAAAAQRHERRDATLRAAAGGAVTVHGGEEATVICEADATPRAAPLHRFARVHPVPGREPWAGALRPLAPHLAAVGLAGFGADTAEVQRRATALGASRVCPPGRLQAPPLAWRHDGLPVLVPLAQLHDLEVQ